MTAEFNNAALLCYLRHQIIEGLECLGLPSRPNPLWIKVVWVHVAGIARTHNNQSRRGDATTSNWPPSPLPCCHLAVHSLLQGKKKKERPVGCLECVTELILSRLERFICMSCSAAVFSTSICLKVNALFNPLFLMIRLEPSAPSKPVDLHCTISLSDPCFLLFCTLTLDQINEVSQYFWLFVSCFDL